MRMQRNAVHLARGTVRCVEEIFDTFRPQTNEYDFVFEGVRVKDTVEQLAERKLRVGIHIVPVVEQKLVTARVGVDVGAIGGFERPERRRAKADIRGIIRITSYNVCYTKLLRESAARSASAHLILLSITTTAKP